MYGEVGLRYDIGAVELSTGYRYANMTDDEVQQSRIQQQLQVGTFGSSHSYHVNFVYADGSAKAMSRQVASIVLEQLMNRRDVLDGKPGQF